MSTRKLVIQPNAAGCIPVWIYAGSSQTGINAPGSIGDMILLGDGSIVLRNGDTIGQQSPNIYEAFGPGGISGQSKATSDTVIMPSHSGVPSSGQFNVAYFTDATALQAFNVPAATLQAAINAGALITAAGGVTVTGAAGGPYTVTFNVNGTRLIAFSSGPNTLGPTSNSNRVGVVTVKVITQGDAAHPCVQTITPAIARSISAGLVIGGNNGRVNSALLGTFIAAAGLPLAPALPTGMAAVAIGGKNYLFCGGIFLNYYRKAVTTPMQSVALIDIATGQLLGGVTGGAITKNANLSSQVFAPRVFSNGATGFGIHSVGSIFGYAGDANGAYGIAYVYSYAAIAPSHGLETLVSVKQVGGSLSISPIATYRGSGFNGPILINADGSPGSVFSSARMSLARPYPIGGGSFVQDSYLARPNQDGTGTVGTFLGTAVMTWALAGSTLTLTITGAVTNFLYYFAGGSTGVWSGPIASTAAAVNAAIQAMFPDCAVSVVDHTAGNSFNAVVTVILPAGARYYPYISSFVATYVSSMQWETALNVLSIGDSGGGSNSYYPIQASTFNTGGDDVPANPICSAIAVNGGAICHAYCWAVPSGPIGQPSGNLQWTITIPGVARINVALVSATGTSNQGQNTTSNQYAQGPISIVPFKSGFAIALPYVPRLAGAASAPPGYAWNKASGGSPTVTLSSPVIVIDSAGNVDTSFDATCFANFFALARTDGARFGPKSLLVKDGSLYFGSLYMPVYLDALHAARQIDDLGGLISPPTWAPFSPPGPNLEVFCACDTDGNKVLPAAHP